MSTLIDSSQLSVGIMGDSNQPVTLLASYLPLPLLVVKHPAHTSCSTYLTRGQRRTIQDIIDRIDN
jgi:hypothetical protein